MVMDLRLAARQSERGAADGGDRGGEGAGGGWACARRRGFEGVKALLRPFGTLEEVWDQV